VDAPLTPHARLARAAAVVALWTLAGLLLAAQAYFSRALRGEPVAWGQAAGTWLAWAYFCALLTPVALWLAARFTRGPVAIAVHLAAGVALAALNLALFALVAPALGAINAAETWLATFERLLGSAYLLNLPVYAGIVAVARGLAHARTARVSERRELKLETELAQARLDALRSQLEPHFLFNALNTVSVLMHEDVDAAERVLVRLGALLRRTLEASGAHETRLGDEIAFAEAYLEIERARFEDRLSYRVEVEASLLEARVPALILQPLVENAVRYGGTEPGASVRVEIVAARRGDALEVTVRDDGPGVVPGVPERVGLANARARLALLYGEQQSLAISPVAPHGTAVSFRVPYRTLSA